MTPAHISDYCYRARPNLQKDMQLWLLGGTSRQPRLKDRVVGPYRQQSKRVTPKPVACNMKGIISKTTFLEKRKDQ